jgi:hypothetical protein
MTAAFEPTPQPDVALIPAMSAKAASVRAALARFLPPAIIGVGLGATIGWVSTLLWILLRIIL